MWMLFSNTEGRTEKNTTRRYFDMAGFNHVVPINYFAFLLSTFDNMEGTNDLMIQRIKDILDGNISVWSVVQGDVLSTRDDSSLQVLFVYESLTLVNLS